MTSKRILGLDLGTNSIGWSVVNCDFEKNIGKIDGAGVRIIPMSQDVLGKFDAGVSISQTAERTTYRGGRRLIQRNLLRRERLHRVLNIIGFLPKHYANAIDFEKHFGQFKKGEEVKLNYERKEDGKYYFLFEDSYIEMETEFRKYQPSLFYTKDDGNESGIPKDWTIYYLRKKALTQKITKEELAWIILNFNQKRGYYQLRGEEVEDQSKSEDYHSLKVVSVIATDDTNAKGTWYEVGLENDWIYKRQSKEPLESWVGSMKEFIVTTNFEKDGSPKKDKEGRVKRSFRSVDSEKDWIAIKKKTELSIESSNKTVGEFLYDALLQDPKQKLRGKLVKTIERKFYKQEFSLIIEKQSELHSELKDRKLYKGCIQELYPRNEAHREAISHKPNDKMFSYLLKDDILFYQRPLKSKKSSIADCSYEFRQYQASKIIDGESQKVWVKEYLKGAPKSNPYFQEFRLWQFLRNLKIYQKEDEKENVIDLDITNELITSEEEWCNLFDYLNKIVELEQRHLIDYFVKLKLIDKKEKSNYRWNYVEDKKYPGNETRGQLLNRFKKVEGVKPESFLTKKLEYKLWHIIYSVKDILEFQKTIENLAVKLELGDSFIQNFKSFPPYKNDYAAYSEKALKKLLPLMRQGRYWKRLDVTNEIECRAKNIYDRINQIDQNEPSHKVQQQIIDLADDDIPKQLIRSFLNVNQESLKGLNTYQACYLVYNRHSEIGEITRWNTPEDIDLYLKTFKQHSLRNPIVEQVVTETLRTVRDIWTVFGAGKEKFFNEIHVELGREMKNDKKTREKISKSNVDHENTNSRIRKILEELKNEGNNEIKPYSPSQQEALKIYEEGVYQNPAVSFEKLKEEEVEKIRKNSIPKSSEINKYKLWLEQGYVSPYTGKLIPLNKLFSIDYQIEHIIPQSRYFDNSIGNKVICESEINELKDNRTAFEFIKDERGRKVVLSGNRTVELFGLEQFEEHCNRYFKKSRTKLKNLLSEDIPEGFINRQLNDSRYISKLIMGLLSNVVREDGETDATSKNLVPVSGRVTSKLKQDWGLNNKWNELIAPRFERLNELTKSNDFGYFDSKINAFRIQVPEKLARGFNKKRIDHRHHTLDAIVIACCSKKHINYLGSLNTQRENHGLKNSLLVKNDKGHYTKAFELPWSSFPNEVKSTLETTIVSFKQNLRVINKTNNKTWQWVTKGGKQSKELVKQTKGGNTAIRQSMHEATFSGLVNLPRIKVAKGKQLTATRKLLDSSFNLKKIEKITDTGIQKILINYLKQPKFAEVNKNGETTYNPELAFSHEGIEEMNENITFYNEGKSHQNILKVRIFEEGSGRFKVGNSDGNKDKYVQGAPNLYYSVYQEKLTGKRLFETVPLGNVIAHRELQREERVSSKELTSVPIRSLLKNKREEVDVEFQFVLSPGDLIYVPLEYDNIDEINFSKLTKEQKLRLYNVNDFSATCYFTPNTLATAIAPKEVDYKFNVKKNKLTGSYDTKTASIDGIQIKDICVKLKVDRLGNVVKVVKC